MGRRWSSSRRSLATDPAPVLPAAVAPGRTRFVRRSVDLTLDDHEKLTRWCNDAAVQIGVARVTGADTFRVLVEQLLTDKALSRAVRKSATEWDERPTGGAAVSAFVGWS